MAGVITTTRLPPSSPCIDKSDNYTNLTRSSVVVPRRVSSFSDAVEIIEPLAYLTLKIPSSASAFDFCCHRKIPLFQCAQGEEDRRRTQEAINTVLEHLASAAVGLIANPRYETAVHR